MPEGVSQAASLAHAVTRILVAYNSAAALGYSHLDSRVLQTLLVDNASRDGTVREGIALGYKAIEMGYNAGYSRAINRGLREASTEFALIANPDLKIDPLDIGVLVSAAHSYPDADIFVPRIFEPEGDEFFRSESRFEPRMRGSARNAPQADACICTLSGAVLLVRRKAFIESGGFDENIFLYFEDDDIGLRWRKAGRPIVFVAEARAEHLGNQSSGSSAAAARIKNQAFGWSWAYIMKKHGIGHLTGAVASTMGKCIAHTLTLNMHKARRDAQILSGLFSFARGCQAPFPD